MPDDDLVVALTWADGRVASLEVEVADLVDGVAETGVRIEAIERRVENLRRRTATSTVSPSEPLLRPVPETVPAVAWEALVANAAASVPREGASLDDLIDKRTRSGIDRDFDLDGTFRVSLDRYDILAAVAAGVTGALLDYLVVSVPNTSSLTTSLRSLAADSDNWLSAIAKVPYDRVTGIDIDGFNPQTHRVQTFGHDPLLGWVYGTMDILRGSLTGVAPSGAVGALQITTPGTDSLAVALAIQAAHLVSDVITPAGLPLPGWTALLTVDATAPGASHTVSELARLMYIRGYDTWHLPSLATPTLGIEAVLRGYLGIRQLVDDDYRTAVERDLLRSRGTAVSDLSRYRAMSLIATSVAAAGNAGRFVLSGANPLTLNYVLWLRFASQSLRLLDSPSVAVRVIDQVHGNRLVLDAGWDRIADDLPGITP